MKCTLDEFYRIGWPTETKWWWFDIDQTKLSDRSSVESKIMLREWDRRKTIYLKNIQGTSRTDMPGNTLAVPIVSSRLLDVLRLASKQQLQETNCELYSRKGKQIVDKYFVLLDIPIGCGPVDSTKGVSLLYSDLWKTDPWLTDAVGVYFDLSTWTGDLLFYCKSHKSELFAHRSIIDKVVDNNFLGIEIVSVLDIGRDVRDEKVRDNRRKGLMK